MVQYYPILPQRELEEASVPTCFMLIGWQKNNLAGVLTATGSQHGLMFQLQTVLRHSDRR